MGQWKEVKYYNPESACKFHTYDLEQKTSGTESTSHVFLFIWVQRQARLICGVVSGFCCHRGGINDWDWAWGRLAAMLYSNAFMSGKDIQASLTMCVFFSIYIMQ